MRIRAVLAVALLGALCGVAAGQDFGNVAPSLRISEWVKGEPIDLSKRGDNVYVLGFWATWCKNSQASTPTITQLQRDFRDRGVKVAVITDEPADVVRKFVDEQSDAIGFSVAVDADKATQRRYIAAYSLPGIPQLFIIDRKGRIIWYDHPQAETFRDVLTRVVENRFEPADALVQRKLIVERRSLVGQIQRRAAEYYRLITEGTTLEYSRPVGEQLLQLAADEPRALNEIAWTILTDERVKHRDMELALRMAETANEKLNGKNPEVLDTLARAQFDSGQVQAAIVTQKLAVEYAYDEAMKKRLSEALKRYQQPASKPAGG